MSQIKSEPLSKYEIPFKIRMERAREVRLRPDRRGKSRIPLELHLDNLLALFDSFVTSAFLPSARNHESSDLVIARSLDVSLGDFGIWLSNIKASVPDALSSLDSLRILGELGEPVGSMFLKILKGLETDLTGLSAPTADNKFVSIEQFRATCARVEASVDRLLGLQDALVEELTARASDIRNILNEESNPANHRLPVVCFDGGGVRSYSSLLILKALMDEVRSVARASEEKAITESSRPCDVFTYIFGSCSGGLVAIMLGRLNMTEEQCKETFRTYTESIFRHHRGRRYAFSAGPITSKYSGESLVRATKDVIRSFDPTPESEKWKRNMFAAAATVERCRCGVLAYAYPDDNVNEGVPYIFRTYKNTSTGARNPGKAQDCQIWEVALATTAAPGYFPDAKFDGRSFSDGGFGPSFGNCNPSYVASLELSDLHPSNSICLVSIGAGKWGATHERRSDTVGRFLTYIKATGSLAIHTESVDQKMRRLATLSERFNYFRFNVPGLDKVFPNEWTVKTRKQWPSLGKMHTIDFIERQTYEYLAQDETRTMIRACAQMVVHSYCSTGFVDKAFSPL
ncbi:hypothetical protein JMJ35_005162 [Cladonia borealis]|uniref:PNPLA domain-containing protein n=1 Tax=Cladonia borealis TaxID=184061 RepID=A0AA39R193_9LECA|nr:hypothetical protein JMJ35_005162 [Cladonia borealis]